MIKVKFYEKCGIPNAFNVKLRRKWKKKIEV